VIPLASHLSSTVTLRREIESEQLSKLRSLLAVVAVSNPFYSSKLRNAGIRGEFSSLDEFFERMPLTGKQELIADQLASPPYGSNLTYPIEHYTRLTQTSSTSGKALRWLDTPESWDWMLDSWQRVYQAAGITAGERIFFAFSFGLFLGFWTAFDAAARLGCLRVPGGGMSSAARLGAMLDNAVTVLCCTPTYALRLAEVAAEERIDLAASKVRRIIVAGEAGGSIPAVRARIEASWPGARVVDHHGMTETGPVSYGCPARPGVLHVIESAFIAEVIDPESGRAVPPGGRGELVLTNLGRMGSPLLRYRTGDLVERSEDCRCECGSSEMALPGGILARADDMVVVRGVNVYPSAVEEILRADGVAEYRVEIDTGHPLPELRVLVEPSLECTDVAGMEKRLQAGLRTALGLRIAVTSVSRGELPRFEMKAQRWVRRI
jgi:phenylacetate-CoA ligase